MSDARRPDPAASPAPRIAREDPGHPDAVALIDALSDALAAITGASGRASSDPATLRGPGTCFLVARDAAGRAVGCGAFRPLPAGELGDAADGLVPAVRASSPPSSAVEIKRMYAAPGTRGVGAALLRALEAEARAQGAGLACCETRRVNARAVAFYERHGYVALPRNYGRYAGRGEAVCLGRWL